MPRLHTIDFVHTDMLHEQPVAVILGRNMITVATGTRGIVAHVVPAAEISAWSDIQQHELHIYGADNFERDGLCHALEYLSLDLGFNPSDRLFSLAIRSLVARVHAHKLADEQDA